MNKINEKIKSRDWGTSLILSLSLIGLTMVVWSFFAAEVMTKGLSWGEQTGVIGDTIGGIMNPFIAIAGVAFTYLAFYMQYRANKELKLDSIRSSFENQFYERVRICKENIKDFKIIVIDDTFIASNPLIYKKYNWFDRLMTVMKSNSQNAPDQFKFKEISGQNAFEYMLNEYELVFDILNSIDLFKVKSIKNKCKIAYTIFFYGIDDRENMKQIWYEFGDTDIEARLIETRLAASKGQLSLNFLNKNFGISESKYLKLQYKLFSGYYLMLNQYYRHLYGTVRYTVNSRLYNYEDKRNFLRFLRSQMPIAEQVMLFYNWYSGRGWQWEGVVKGVSNNYLTDYRMIHNVYNGVLLKEIDLKKIFPNEPKKEKNAVNDFLFEHEEWEIG